MTALLLALLVVVLALLPVLLAFGVDGQTLGLGLVLTLILWPAIAVMGGLVERLHAGFVRLLTSVCAALKPRLDRVGRSRPR